MASRLTPIGWIAKFLAVPAALGAVGFYLLGPRIGAVRPAPRLPIPLPISGSSSDDKPTGAAVQDSPPSGVEVTVKPASSTNPGSGPNLGQDSDSSASAGATSDDPKPRVRPGRRPASMVAPPTDPQPGEDGSGGQ